MAVDPAHLARPPRTRLGGHTFSYGSSAAGGGVHGFHMIKHSFGSYAFAVPARHLAALRDGFSRDLARDVRVKGARSAGSAAARPTVSPDVSWFTSALMANAFVYATDPLLIRHEPGYSNTRADRVGLNISDPPGPVAPTMPHGRPGGGAARQEERRRVARARRPLRSTRRRDGMTDPRARAQLTYIMQSGKPGKPPAEEAIDVARAGREKKGPRQISNGSRTHAQKRRGRAEEEETTTEEETVLLLC